MKFKSCVSSVIAVAAVIVFLSSCSRQEREPDTYVIEGVALDITSAEMIPGETVTLTATLLPYNTVVDESTLWDSGIKDNVFWKSDNPDVAQVDGNGLVTAKGAGTCTVSFICGALAAKCRITVRSFDKKILFGMWEVEGSGDEYYLGFDGGGYLNGYFMDWTFDGMRFSATYKGSMEEQPKTIVITSVKSGKIYFYYLDDKEKQQFFMRRVPVPFTLEHLTIGETEIPAKGDSAVSVVDLGLPSGLLWATSNLGAATPDKYGEMYAWAETAPKQSYILDNYRWYDTASSELTKYTDGSVTEMQADDDPVSVSLGGKWHTPSVAEASELFDNCYVIYGSLADSEGLMFIPKDENYSDRRLFIPFSMSSDNNLGSVYGGDVPQGGKVYDKFGFLWTSTLSQVNPFEAYYMCISLDDNDVRIIYDKGKTKRYFGLCIRPVVK